MSVLDDLKETMRQLELLDMRPTLKSVTMHPEDFEILRRIARTKANVRVDSDEMFGPLRFDGIPIYQSDYVPKGRPWYDPPEAGPTQRQRPDAEG